MVIVGGGVIGLTLAWELAGQGVQVTVLDQSAPAQEASWAGAGMLPPGNADTAVTPEQLLRGHSHKLWRSMSAELRETTGIDNGFREWGSLELFSRTAAEQLPVEVARWQSEQVPVTKLNAGEYTQFAPAVSQDFVGYHLPTFAQVRNPRHLKALLTACGQRGVQIHAGCAVTGFVRAGQGGRVSAVLTNTGKFPADRFCITAGAWSGMLLESLGVSLPVRPVRGQIVQLSQTPLPFTQVLEVGRRYLVPRPDGRILIGATEERVGFHKQNTARGVTDLLQFAQTLVPSLATAGVERCWSGLRPGSPDELPYLGPLPECDNVFVAAGHFRSGLQMSPATARVMRQCLLGQPLAFSLKGLECERHHILHDGESYNDEV